MVAVAGEVKEVGVGDEEVDQEEATRADTRAV